MREIIKTASDIPLLKPFVRFYTREISSYKAAKIANHLTKYLTPLIANTEDLKAESYRIRHQVCCEELQALPIQASSIEIDNYDEHATHCLIQHKATGQFTGTVRVVYSRSPNERLPLESFYLDKIYPGEYKPTDFPRDQICEASRLIVPKNFRRRSIDNMLGAENGVINTLTYSENELRCFPFIAISLYLAAANVIIQNNMGHCFIMVEPKLAQSLNFVGIPVKQIGPVIDYFGKRAGYYIDQETLENNLPHGITRLRKVINQSLYPVSLDSS